MTPLPSIILSKGIVALKGAVLILMIANSGTATPAGTEIKCYGVIGGEQTLLYRTEQLKTGIVIPAQQHATNIWCMTTRPIPPSATVVINGAKI